jgi:phosphoribosylaminoimidazole (AIR) synthetase
MGLGMLVFVSPDQASLAQQTLSEVYIVGEMVTGLEAVEIQD